ncbi:MAG: hypothetical protein IPN09_09265 [Bacteroidetes bacterium]|nr:hypothetical protein [Bacteroidota bacterium]
MLANSKTAKGLNGSGWFLKVRPGGDWDYKANGKTIFGIAWSRDLTNEKSGGNFTSFLFESTQFGKQIFEDASDFGNYHAGFMGRMTYNAIGLSYQAQWNAAGYGEAIKDFLNEI